jgi:heat shock protein HslJ
MLSACAASGSDASALLDKTFTTSSITTAGVTEPLAQGSTLSITFTSDGVSAKADCNTLFGPATLDDGVVAMTNQVASTMMACDPALMDQDQRIIDFLSAGPSWSLDGTTLTLATGDTTMTLTQSAQ